jgi:hypothetical protein
MSAVAAAIVWHVLKALLDAVGLAGMVLEANV